MAVKREHPHKATGWQALKMRLFAIEERHGTTPKRRRLASVPRLLQSVHSDGGWYLASAFQLWGGEGRFEAPLPLPSLLPPLDHVEEHLLAVHVHILV